MTAVGGVNNLGTIFKIKPDGTGYYKLFDFSTSANGAIPYGALISDGTFLYGMTPYGGINGDGVIFKIKPDGTGYNDLYNFLGSPDGNGLQGNLISDGNILYGMTYSGGTNNDGVIFSYHPIGMGISDNAIISTITIYPNPTNGFFYVQVSKSGNLQINICNVLGECIHEQNSISSNFQIDLSSQPNGIYFINIKTEQGIVSKKIIINR